MIGKSGPAIIRRGPAGEMEGSCPAELSRIVESDDHVAADRFKSDGSFALRILSGRIIGRIVDHHIGVFGNSRGGFRLGGILCSRFRSSNMLGVVDVSENILRPGRKS